jgi:hypothetical protein
MSGSSGLVLDGTSLRYSTPDELVFTWNFKVLEEGARYVSSARILHAKIILSTTPLNRTYGLGSYFDRSTLLLLDPADSVFVLSSASTQRVPELTCCKDLKTNERPQKPSYHERNRRAVYPSRQFDL